MGWGGREGQWITTLSSEASGQRAASLHLAEKLCHFFFSSVTEHYNRRMLVISELAVTETLRSKKKFSPTP